MADEALRKAVERGHEPIEASARSVLRAYAIIMATVIFVLGVVAALIYTLGDAGRRRPIVQTGLGEADLPATVAELNASQEHERAELQQLEQRYLNEYAWVNRTDGIARIPVSRAMQILAERGTETPEGGEDGE